MAQEHYSNLFHLFGLSNRLFEWNNNLKEINCDISNCIKL